VESQGTASMSGSNRCSIYHYAGSAQSKELSRSLAERQVPQKTETSIGAAWGSRATSGSVTAAPLSGHMVTIRPDSNSWLLCLGCETSYKGMWLTQSLRRGETWIKFFNPQDTGIDARFSRLASQDKDAFRHCTHSGAADINTAYGNFLAYN
jgi:hypothetical protein